MRNDWIICAFRVINRLPQNSTKANRVRLGGQSI
nr:MAG TPA: hypothetical protein [Caudoviricetes sp.]